MFASEALELTNKSNRIEAIKKRIFYMEEKIKKNAKEGYRYCIADFKWGGYDLEKEIKEYFTKNGFTFKLITNDICGGVLQSPYWIVCW